MLNPESNGLFFNDKKEAKFKVYQMILSDPFNEELATRGLMFSRTATATFGTVIRDRQVAIMNRGKVRQICIGKGRDG